MAFVMYYIFAALYQFYLNYELKQTNGYKMFHSTIEDGADF